MSAQTFRGWRTSTGEITEDAAAVQRAEFEAALRRWWNQNRRADWPDSMFDAIVRDRDRLAVVFGELTKTPPALPGTFIPRVAT